MMRKFFEGVRDYFTTNVGVTPEVRESYGESMSYYDNRATIRQMKNGKFRLLSGPQGNEVVATYSRRRDAIRGAQRKGLSLA
jgi:hypothetical protein